SDLLQQINVLDKIDLSDLLRPAPIQFIAPDKAGNISTSDIFASAVAAGAEWNDYFPATLNTELAISRSWSKIVADSRILGTRYSSFRVRDRYDGSYEQL